MIMHRPLMPVREKKTAGGPLPQGPRLLAGALFAFVEELVECVPNHL